MTRLITGNQVVPILRLAGPVLLARAGAIMVLAADVIMCGYAGTKELAYYGLANGVHVTVLLIGIGSLLGIAILVATSDGASRCEQCGVVWRVGLLHAIVLGVILGVILQFGEEFFLLTGQTAELSEGSGKVLAMHGFGLIGFFCLIATSLFLEGLQRPVPAMLVSFVVIFVNVFLNWIFIFGNLGAPVMGAEGAALATSIVRWISFLLLLAYVYTAIPKKYGISTKILQMRTVSKRLLKLGNPTAIAHGMESSSFMIMTLFAGYMGVAATAAWAVGLNLITIAFMLALGFAMAGSVRVANHLGKGNAKLAKGAGWTAITLSIIALGLVTLVFLFFPEELAHIYVKQPEVMLIAVPTVLAASFIVLLDGVQAVGVGVLRGYQDMWYITMTMIVSFWIVMLPCAWLLGLKLDGGPPALMLAIGVACVVAISMLFGRFHYLSTN